MFRLRRDSLSSTCTTHPLAKIYSWDFLKDQLTNGLAGPPIELHIFRHAESVANARGIVAGQSDVELSWRGYVQALGLGLRLPRCDSAWVSSLGRTHKTLQIAGALRLQRIS